MSHSLSPRCQDHGHVPHPDRGCAEGCGTHGVTDVPCWRECPDWAGLTDAEREALANVLGSITLTASTWGASPHMDKVAAAVEHIVAAREAAAVEAALAPVLALADRWDLMAAVLDHPSEDSTTRARGVAIAYCADRLREGQRGGGQS